MVEISYETSPSPPVLTIKQAIKEEKIGKPINLINMSSDPAKQGDIKSIEFVNLANIKYLTVEAIFSRWL